MAKFFFQMQAWVCLGLSENMLPHSVACSDPHVVFKIAIHVGIPHVENRHPSAAPSDSGWMAYVHLLNQED